MFLQGGGEESGQANKILGQINHSEQWAFPSSNIEVEMADFCQNMVIIKQKEQIFMKQKFLNQSYF